MALTTTVIADFDDVQRDLPDSWQSWKMLPAETFCRPWDTLRAFFDSFGYDLYQCNHERLGYMPRSGRQEPPSDDSFELFGDRGDGFICRMIPASTVFAARDRKNRDVVIKVVSKGDENIHELQILQLLNSEQLKSDPLNATVPVVEFVNFLDWTFAVMPFCDESFEPVMRNADESLELAEQILRALTFLHDNRIAHMDISHENIVINHHGKIPRSTIWYPETMTVEIVWPPPDFRTFPIQYLILDFGISHSFPITLPLGDCWTAPTNIGRYTQAPEVGITRFNPFAADVYQTAMLFYDWFHNLTPDVVPGLLPLLQDMSSFYAPSRPSMATALQRLVRLRAQLPQDKSLMLVRGLEPGQPRYIPRHFLRHVHEIYRARGLSTVALFTYGTLKNGLKKVLTWFGRYFPWMAPKYSYL